MAYDPTLRNAGSFLSTGGSTSATITAPGGTQGEHDVDGGKTTLFSPVLDLSGVSNARVRYYRCAANRRGEGPRHQ